MICKVLKIKEASIVPERSGAQVDVHQWQALLRSLSGYEPYRRAYDARIDPSQVLDFALRRTDFPLSLVGCFVKMRAAIGIISASSPMPPDLDLTIARVLQELRYLADM